MAALDKGRYVTGEDLKRLEALPDEAFFTVVRRFLDSGGSFKHTQRLVEMLRRVVVKTQMDARFSDVVQNRAFKAFCVNTPQALKRVIIIF